MRLGDVKDNSKSLQSAVQELEQIAGQKLLFVMLGNQLQTLN